MVQGVADLAFHHTTRVIRVDQFQTIRAAVLLLTGKQQFGLGMLDPLTLRFDRLGSY